MNAKQIKRPATQDILDKGCIRHTSALERLLSTFKPMEQA
jgi:hypothetical protein